MDKAISLTDDIIKSTNIYELKCTPDRNAVEVLEKVLDEN